METPWDEYHMMFEDAENQFHAGTLIWCMHCERAYPMEDMVKAGEMWWCKYYPECDGAILDIQSWRNFRNYNRQYPEVPVVGEAYPMYPPNESA